MDDGALLREGAAIVQYLADTAPQAQLIPPAGTMERLRAQEWLNFIATEFHKQFIPLLRGAPDEVLTAQRDKIGRVLAELEQHLSTRNYMMGDRFTVVDAYIFTITNWCQHHKVRLDLQPYPSVRAFMTRVAQRGAVQDALRAEGLV
jgi:glutathione S-transferase